MQPEKQHKFRIILYCVNTVVLIFGFLFVGILSIFLPKPTVSEMEKRTLATVPKFSVEALLSGEYFHGWEKYYADTFPARDALVKTASMMDSAKGISLNDMRIYEVSSQPSSVPAAPEQPEDSSGESTAPLPEEEEKPLPKPVDDGTVGEQIGSSFVYKDMALPIFWGNLPAGQRYANVLNQYAEALDGQTTVYNLIIPSSIEFYLPDKYQSVTTPQKENIQSIYSMMDKRIHTVDAYSSIAAHTDEYLYFRTDHHWTARGAYYAYRAFAKAAGFIPTPLEDMEAKTLSDPFLGTLYSQTQDASLAKHPDYLEYFVSPVGAVNNQYVKGSPYTPKHTSVLAEYATGPYSYSLFLHGDYPLSHIQTELHNGKNIMIVKESFGNAFAPFLINNYENIYVVDQRYFQLNLLDFIRANNIQELLFINNIFAAQTDIRTNEIYRLMTQQYMPYPPAVQEEKPAEKPPKENPVQQPVSPNQGNQLPPAPAEPLPPPEESEPSQEPDYYLDEEEKHSSRYEPPKRVRRESAYNKDGTPKEEKDIEAEAETE